MELKIENGVVGGIKSIDIVIPAGVTEIDKEAFVNYHEFIASVTIPASVTYIGYGAFAGCKSLQTVTFATGSQLQSIDYRAFYDCDSLTGITIPASVTKIGYDTFANCTNLQTLNFAEGSQPQSVGDWAFYCCYNLTSITISASVTSIGQFAFENCSRLNTVYYKGTPEQARQTKIEAGNECLLNAEWIYCPS